MRLKISPTVNINIGDLVTCTVKNSVKCKHSRVSVWSAVGDFEFSPHVLTPVEELVGKPIPLQPMMHTVRGANGSHTFSFVADEKMKICVMQDIDYKGDPTAKAKVKSYGKINQKIRQYFRNIIRYASNCNVAKIWFR